MTADLFCSRCGFNTDPDDDHYCQHENECRMNNGTHGDTRIHCHLCDANGGFPSEDQPLPEDAQIEAAHPVKSGKHATYAEAMRLVSAKHRKASLVGVVNWLLVRLEEALNGAFEAGMDKQKLEKQVLELRQAHTVAGVERIRLDNRLKEQEAQLPDIQCDICSGTMKGVLFTCQGCGCRRGCE